MLAFPFTAPFHKIMIDLFAESLATRQGDDAKGASRNRFQVSFFFRHGEGPHFLFANLFLCIRISGPVSLQNSKPLVILEKILS